MKKLLSTATAFALLAGAAHAEGKLSVYHWFEYIPQELVDKFTAETGIQVNYDTFDATAVVEAKLLAGKTGYDVVLWIEEAVFTQGFAPPRMQVHSANASAKQKMLAGIAAIEQRLAHCVTTPSSH